MMKTVSIPYYNHLTDKFRSKFHKIMTVQTDPNVLDYLNNITVAIRITSTRQGENQCQLFTVLIKLLLFMLFLYIKQHQTRLGSIPNFPQISQQNLHVCTNFSNLWVPMAPTSKFMDSMAHLCPAQTRFLSNPNTIHFYSQGTTFIIVSKQAINIRSQNIPQ
ncbi:biotin synthase [Striga asiatica]|uniref:Biotin synthase n=1 Tax=Striga asiatica TaxID=4170 RepID=A0A5A7P4E3_STRAF|nr:biotin synthase [Striga asiatica]